MLALVTGTAGIDVHVIILQVAEVLEHAQQALLILRRQLLVEGIAIHRLGKQLGNISALIGMKLAGDHGLVAKTPRRLEERRTVVVGEDFEVHFERFAIIEDGPVVIGYAGRAHIGVEVSLVVKIHPLRAAELFDHYRRFGRSGCVPRPARWPPESCSHSPFCPAHRRPRDRQCPPRE